MAILRIRIFPDPILRKKARKIQRVDEPIKKLARNMIETMQNANGIGLAGPQVGQLKRIITIQVPEEEAFAMINPEITRREGQHEVLEGCLSVPGYQGLVTRSVSIKARALDEAGSKFKLDAEELRSQAIEHEVDHLNGIMFLDHLVAHEELHKVGVSPGDPHWHDVGYKIYADHSDGLPSDRRLVELLTATAELSKLQADSSLEEAQYDLRSAEEGPEYVEEPPVEGGLAFD